MKWCFPRSRWFASLAVPALLGAVLLWAVSSPASAQDTGTGSSGSNDPATTYVFEVRTVPAIAGLVFSLDGETQTTGSDGLAKFEVPYRRNGRFDRVAHRRVEIETTQLSLSPTSRATFSRWRGQSAEQSVVAQMSIDNKVTFELSDVQGAPVDPERVDELTLKSSVGEVRSISPSDSPWLLGTRVVPGHSSLDEKQVFWTVQTATDSGLDVVRRSGTKFFPAVDQHVMVETLYFSARFEMIDAFFGFPTGDTLVIETPDGQILREPIIDGVVSLEQMARGEYTMTVEGKGMRLSRPVSITRNQDVDLKLYTWLDLGLVAAVGLLFAVTPIYIGVKRRRRTRLFGDPGSPSGALTAPPPAHRGPPQVPDTDRRPKGGPTEGGRQQVLSLAMGLALLLSLSFPSLPATFPANPVEPGDPPVLAHYYIWFDATSWNRAKVDFPALGRYSSDEASTMRRHIEQAQAAGIDGFIVSWKSTDVNNARLEQLIGIAEDLDFKLVMSYQGLDFNRDPLPAARIGDDLDDFLSDYASSPVFELFDRPTMVLAGSWKFSVEDLARITDDRRSSLYILASEKNVEGYERVAEVVDGDLYYWSSVDPGTNERHQSKLGEMADVVHDYGGLWIAPAAPGFDARLVGGTSVVGRHDGETLRLSWQAALNSLPDAIGVISWNEFSENTHIEPSTNYGAASLAVVADLTGAPDAGALDFDSSAPSSSPGLTSSANSEQSYGRVLAVGLFTLVVLISLFAVSRRSNKPADRGAPTLGGGG